MSGVLTSSAGLIVISSIVMRVVPLATKAGDLAAITVKKNDLPIREMLKVPIFYFAIPISRDFDTNLSNGDVMS